MGSPHTATKSSPHSLQLEKACVQQWRPSTAKNKQIMLNQAWTTRAHVTWPLPISADSSFTQCPLGTWASVPFLEHKSRFCHRAFACAAAPHLECFPLDFYVAHLFTSPSLGALVKRHLLSEILPAHYPHLFLFLLPTLFFCVLHYCSLVFGVFVLFLSVSFIRM